MSDETCRDADDRRAGSSSGARRTGVQPVVRAALITSVTGFAATVLAAVIGYAQARDKAEPPTDGQPAAAAPPAGDALTEGAPEVPPWWRPAPLGHPAAIESLASIAAPLLGGFSITLLGVVAQAPQEFRWHGISIMILAAAASVLIWCVQCGFWTRQYAVSRADVYAWFGGFNGDPELKSDIKDEQIKQGSLYRGWERRTRRSYASGILLLLAGVATCVAPPHFGKKSGVATVEVISRWAGVGVLAAVFVLELLWMAAQSDWVERHCPWCHDQLAPFITPKL